MDIVERLRQKAHEMPLPPTMELRQAADEIERLREALERIAKIGDHQTQITIARSALQQKDSE